MMIYMVVVIFLIIWLMNYLMYRDVFSPTSVMCLVWGVTLTLVSVYQSGFFEISNESLLWIMSGVIAFFIGGLISIPLSKISLPSKDVYPIGMLVTTPIYAVMFFLACMMSIEGASVNDNFYIGIRSIINYGEPSWYFTMFGYMYYIIYPLFFISCVSHYIEPFSKKRKSLFILHGVMALLYAVIATAKVKLLIVMITWFVIRTYYKKVTYKLATTVGVSFLVLFFLSLIVLNKLSNGDNIIESATSSIGNYIIANVFAFDSLKFNPIPSDLCANNDPSCTFLPFYDVGIFHTNVYTFLYDYMPYGWLVFSLSLLLIGFFHNMLHTMGRKTKNPVVIIISALLYFPLVYQVINDQYFSSKYLVYLSIVTFVIYFFNKRASKFKVIQR